MVALVGGTDYDESPFNRATAAHRQPGSAFKPFVYLTALETRADARDTCARTSRSPSMAGSRRITAPQYLRPGDADAEALAHSLNTVSVRLTLEFGVRSPWCARRTARHHIEARSQRLDRARHVGSLAARTRLGLCAVRQWRPRGIPTSSNGCARPPARRSTRARRRLGRIVDGRYVAMMNAMMQETLVTGTAHAAALPDRQAAGKTGTSQDFRDAWFVGYTSHSSPGVWLGNDDSSPDQEGDRRRHAGRDLEPFNARGTPGRRAGRAAWTGRRRADGERRPCHPPPSRARLLPTAARHRTKSPASIPGCSTACSGGAD